MRANDMEQEVKEVWRADKILRPASAFFLRGGASQLTQVLEDFIDTVTRGRADLP